MITSQTLAYLSLAFVFAFTPGATTAVVIRHTLDGGRRRGLTASAGAMTASGIQAVLSVVGVGALLMKWPLGLKILGGAGAAYLAWMGARSLRNAIVPPRVSGATVTTTVAGQGGALHPYREGFTINILNPSVTSFYIGVAPTFVPSGAPWTALAFLYAAHISIAFSCHVFWSSLFHQARWLFTGERPRRWLDGAIGVILLWLAWRIWHRI